MVAIIVLGLLILGMLLGGLLVLIMEDFTQPSHPEIEAELDAMAAVDRLFAASDQARLQMRNAAGGNARGQGGRLQ